MLPNGCANDQVAVLYVRVYVACMLLYVCTYVVMLTSAGLMSRLHVNYMDLLRASASAHTHIHTHTQTQ